MILFVFAISNIIAFFLSVGFEMPLVACEKVLFSWIFKAMDKLKGNTT